ncbi:MAG TPA: TolC family protein [Bryobacteraceae bacterium]|nr:TolC family protein [Bryobacteraceae bacterium]
MRSFLPIAGITLVFCSQIVLAQDKVVVASPPLTLTLRDAMDRARQYSQQVYSANIAAQTAHESTIQAKAALLPSVQAQSGYIYTQPNGTATGIFIPADGPHVYIDQLNVHADLYDAVARAQYRQTMAAEALAKARKDIAERGLIATVSQDYYGMLSAQRKIGTVQASLKEARDFQDFSEKQERGGEGALVDVIKARMQVRQRERELQDAGANLEKARMAFAVILFPTYNVEFNVADDLETAPKLPERADVGSMAAKNSPDLRAAQAALQQSTFGERAARAGYLPNLTFDYWYGIQANYFAIHNPDGVNQLGSSLAAQLNIPIWNWGSTRSKVKQAELQVQQAKSDLSLTQRTLLSQLDSYYTEARVASTQIESLRDSVTLSTQNLRLTRLRYAAAESTAQEVVDAQNGLAEARNALEDGLLRYRVAIANLQTLTGGF